MSVDDSSNLTDVLVDTVLDFAQDLTKKGFDKAEVTTTVMTSITSVVAAMIELIFDDFEAREQVLQHLVYTIRHSPGWNNDSDN